MAKFLRGLAQAGAWACFDEFNRIDVEVGAGLAQRGATQLADAAGAQPERCTTSCTIHASQRLHFAPVVGNKGGAHFTDRRSQRLHLVSPLGRPPPAPPPSQVLSVIAQQLGALQAAQRAAAATVALGGREVRLAPGCGVFATMNLGYVGRTELPDNLKVGDTPDSRMDVGMCESHRVCLLQCHGRGRRWGPGGGGGCPCRGLFCACWQVRRRLGLRPHRRPAATRARRRRCCGRSRWRRPTPLSSRRCCCLRRALRQQRAWRARRPRCTPSQPAS